MSRHNEKSATTSAFKTNAKHKRQRMETATHVVDENNKENVEYLPSLGEPKRKMQRYKERYTGRCRVFSEANKRSNNYLYCTKKSDL